MLYFQHDPKWVEDGLPGAGDITVFNNGFGRPGTDYSTTEEIAPPVDINGNYTLAAGQPYGPAGTVWTYTAAAADFSAIISGIQRLPNGDSLITYGVDGTFSEVTSDGTEVWRYVNPYVAGGQLGMEQTIPNLGLTDPGLDTLLVNFTFRAIEYPTAYVPQLTSTVAGRHIFYNNSFYGGNSTAINANDDAAIDPSKSAYIPGVTGLATFANVTGFTKGLNGIMIDLSTGVDHSGLNGLGNVANNFVFKIGNNNTPSGWAVAPTPSDVQVRNVSGVDRVTITWADNAIPNTKWLEVAVLPTAQTGLAASALTVDPDGPGAAGAVAAGDVFFFGNAIGDSGDGDTGAGFAVSSAADEIGARNNPHTFLNPVAVDYQYDYNKDHLVSAAGDENAARNNGTNFLNWLIKINITPPQITAALANDTGPSGIPNNDGITQDPQVAGTLTARLDIPFCREGAKLMPGSVSTDRSLEGHGWRWANGGSGRSRCSLPPRTCRVQTATHFMGSSMGCWPKPASIAGSSGAAGGTTNRKRNAASRRFRRACTFACC